MSNVLPHLTYLKDASRYPKETVTSVTVPKVQVSSEEWNRMVKGLQQVRNNESVCTEILKSFNSEILGELPMMEVALYDDSVEASIDGTKVTLTKLDDNAGWECYGVAIPDTLTEGETYTVQGTVTNDTQHEINVAVISSLYGDGATKSYLYYHVPIGATVTVNNTFTYAAATTKYIIFEAFVGTGNSVTADLHIVNEEASIPQIQEDLSDLQSEVLDNAAAIEASEDAQEDMYTDVYGKKRLIDAVGYDNQVTLAVTDGTLTLTAVSESTGSPHYGIRLPNSLVNGQEYTLKGTFTNNTTGVCPLGNYESLSPSGSPNLWVAYNVAVGATVEINLTFTYNSAYPYIAVSKSNLRYVGDSVSMSLYIEAGEDILGRVEALEGDGVSSAIESMMPAVKATDGTLLTLFNSGTNAGWAITQETKGVRFVASGSTGTYKDDSIEVYPEATEKKFKPNTKYAVFVDMDAETIPLLHEQDTLGISLFFVKSDFTMNSASAYLKAGEILDEGYTRNIQQVVFLESGESDSDFIYVRMALTRMNTTGTTDELCNLLIKRLIIFEVTSPYADYSELDFCALLKNAGDFSTLAVVTAARMPHANLLYDGGKLKSLGDSLPETCSFQPYIAQALGMTYSRTEETTTQTITYEGSQVTAYKSVLGGTRVVPVIRSNVESGASMGSIYMRARSLKYYEPSVLIILAGYNDIQAGQPYVDGGTATEPADYGINDEPYTGGEIDLLSDPTLSVPSFGACYRGMIEQILTDMPYCRIVLCGIPRGSGEVSLFGTDADWVAKKNAVIEHIANEYGLPFVDLSKVYGVNALNYQWLTKDGLHFSDFGGRRVAQELLAKAF